MPIFGGFVFRQDGRTMLRRLRPLLAILALCVGALDLVGPQEASAIPAWARKYNADCAMCHLPTVPRLNNFGQMYRRMGYRTAGEINKDQDITNVNHMLSGRIKTQFQYTDTRGEIARSEFISPDVSLFYAGAVSRNFSALIHAFANNSTNVDFHGHVMGNFGSADNMFMIRIGQMHMLQQEGVGGFDRPTGINTNPVHALALTRAVQAGTGVASPTGGSRYNFDQRQKGVELAYVHGPAKLGLMISNGLNQNGSGTASIGDIDTPKDYMAFYEHLLDDLASGFTVFYYNGTTHGTVTTNAAGQPTFVTNEFGFNRFGFNLSKWFVIGDIGLLEFQGGYVRSHDNNPTTPISIGTPAVAAPVAPSSVTGNAFYVESQQYLTGPEITFFERYSNIDLNGAAQKGVRQDYTAGFVKPLQTWLRFSGEYTYVHNLFGGTGSNILFELQMNY